MTLPENALTTTSVIEDELTLDSPSAAETSRIERYVMAATDLFEKATGRSWHYVEDHEERVPSHGTEYLHVSDHLPVLTLTKIEYGHDGDLTEVDADTYTQSDGEKRGGLIRQKEGTWSDTARRIVEITTEKLAGTEAPLFKITYTGGYVTPQQVELDNTLTRTLPHSIEMAVIDLVVQMWRGRGRDPNVSSEKVLGESISYVNGQAVPPMFARTVAQYKQTAVA